MFSDKFGLTQAVLDGRKTMTRRFIPEEIGDVHYRPTVANCHFFADKNDHEIVPAYHIGEEVAVAQNYEQAGWNPDTLQQTYVKKPTIFPDLDEYDTMCGLIDLPLKYHKGWTNKMFVLGDLMPHRIKITNIKAERLQDISDEDCLKEGIFRCTGLLTGGYSFTGFPVNKNELQFCRYPREAFAKLIDCISGKGTWDKNPYVFAYDFKLIQ